MSSTLLTTEESLQKTLPRDLIASGVVFLVALPLCLGIAVASNAPPISGLIAGIIGGIIVGALSGSHTSVSGPAAGLTAIVSMQIATLGSFEAFLSALVLAGLLQVVMGIFKAGALSAYFPSSVIKGLLAAIGVILILKQIPHILGHDTDPEGEMSFKQPDHKNTFSELLTLFEGEVHAGAIVIGAVSLAILILWNYSKLLKKSNIPAPLIVVLLGVALNLLFQKLGGRWLIEGNHLVQVPVAESLGNVTSFLVFPDLSVWNRFDLYRGAITIAVVASLETLLSLEAVDKLDPEKRNSPGSRELIAQGVGNSVSGLIGGLPVTSVIVRSSVNVHSGAKTKLSAVFHGFLLLISVLFLANSINMIPLASLAAILLITGYKLASPKLFSQMWSQGKYQFYPFIITLLAIVFSDLLIGILIGLGVSILFILNSNLRRPIRRIVESHVGGEVLHIELANQVSFLNRASLDTLFNAAKPGSHLLIDATDTDYFDPDVLSLIREFKENIAPVRGVTVSLRGFRDKYDLHDEILFAHYTSRELQDQMTPDDVIKILLDGNERFRTGRRLSRDLMRQIDATKSEQAPLAAILSCIDSRVPTELVFDLGVGDIFSVRVAGNVIGTKSLGSLEYGVGVAGVKLVLVLGHTRCGAVTSSVQLISENRRALDATGCEHLQAIVDEIAPSVQHSEQLSFLKGVERDAFINLIAKRNVQHTVQQVVSRSTVIRQSLQEGRIKIVGAMYDVTSGEIQFFDGNS